MPDIYWIPKVPVPARVTLVGRNPIPMTLFLSKGARDHAGSERLGDLFNAPDVFLPALDRRGRVQFLRRDAVALVSARIDDETAMSGAVEPVAGRSVRPQRAKVRVRLEDGPTLWGTLDYVMPAGRQRVLDFLNTVEPFLALRRNGLLHVINKRRIMQVTTL